MHCNDCADLSREGKFLFLGLAFQSHTKLLAKIWLNSLFHIGKWRHDVILLGDEITADFTAPRLKGINIIKNIESRYNFPCEEWTRYSYIIPV